MKKLLVILLVFFSIQSDAQQGFVSVKGKEIVDPSGNPLLLKGINLGNWLVPEGYMFRFGNVSSPRLIKEMLKELVGPQEANVFWRKFMDSYITQDDIKLIKKLGFNSVRVPFNFRLFASEDNPEIFFDTGFEMLDRVIRWCAENDLWVILDMHCAPGGQTGDNIDDSYGYPYLFESEESKKLTVKIWKKIAERYSEEKAVLGYDLLNEPIAHYFDKEKLNPLLEPLFKEIVTAVREVDPNHIIFIGGAQWNSDFSVFGEPFDDKLVYTFHKYWTSPGKEVIQSYIDFREKYNVPIWMGESGENTNEWIGEFRTTLEENNIGWCFWPYKKLEASSCIATITKPEGWDVIIEYSKLDRSSYEKIRNSRPDPAVVKNALELFLQNSPVNNCTINEEYVKALGLSPPKN